jgi:hypothetical protein
MYGSSSVDQGERTVDDSAHDCKSECGLAGRTVYATMRTKGARERRHQSREGVGEPGKEEVSVEPSSFIRPLTPEPVGS